MTARKYFLQRLLPIVCFSITLSFTGCKTNYILGEDEGWVFIGQKKVNHIREKDVFKIKTNDKFTALRFYVKDRDVTIKSLEVRLINGDILKPSIENKLQHGERSRIIELAADGRQLDKITFSYRSSGALFSKKGIVQIIGKKYNPNGVY